MKVYKDDRGEHDLERKIEQLRLKVRTYQELIKDSKALFVNKNGRRLSRQSIWSIVKDCTKSINLSIEVTPHTLRHSFATELLKGGANIREVQELMGHSSLSATQIYTSLDNNWVKKEYSNSHPRA